VEGQTCLAHAFSNFKTSSFVNVGVEQTTLLPPRESIEDNNDSKLWSGQKIIVVTVGIAVADKIAQYCNQIELSTMTMPNLTHFRYGVLETNLVWS